MEPYQTSISVHMKRLRDIIKYTLGMAKPGHTIAPCALMVLQMLFVLRIVLVVQYTSACPV
jgi:hypothetical protein